LGGGQIGASLGQGRWLSIDAATSSNSSSEPIAHGSPRRGRSPGDLLEVRLGFGPQQTSRGWRCDEIVTGEQVCRFLTMLRDPVEYLRIFDGRCAQPLVSESRNLRGRLRLPVRQVTDKAGDPHGAELEQDRPALVGIVGRCDLLNGVAEL